MFQNNGKWQRHKIKFADLEWVEELDDVGSGADVAEQQLGQLVPRQVTLGVQGYIKGTVSQDDIREIMLLVDTTVLLSRAAEGAKSKIQCKWYLRNKNNHLVMPK